MKIQLTKRFAAFLMAVIFSEILLPVIPALAAQSGECGENLTWTLDDDGTLTIGGTGAMTNWAWQEDVPWYGNRNSIKTAVIENSVTSIGDRAFLGCRGLTSVTIPDSVTKIGEGAFYGCSGLTSIDVDENNENYCSVDGNLFNKDKTQLIQYAIGKTDVSYKIPDSVTKIGYSAFGGCSGLTSITIPDSVTKIGYSAFGGCSGLTSVTIPDSVTEIGGMAFSGCRDLTSVTIPDSVTSIGLHAFDGCESLTDVYYKGTENQWKVIRIDDDNDPLLSATVHYDYKPTAAQITAIDKYEDTLDVTMTKTGGEVKVELIAAESSEIKSEDIDVFAMSQNGKATKLTPNADGTKFTGNVAGENYKVFVWTKSLVPITQVYDSAK